MAVKTAAWNTWMHSLKWWYLIAQIINATDTKRNVLNNYVKHRMIQTANKKTINKVPIGCLTNNREC